MFSLSLRSLFITSFTFFILSSSIVPVSSTPTIHGFESRRQLSSSTTTTSSTASLPFLYGRLTGKLLRINDAYLGLKSYVLPDDALPASGVSYSPTAHPRPRLHHPFQSQHKHEHDVNDSLYGGPVLPSEYSPPKRPFDRPFVSWSSKSKLYSFKSCLSAMKRVRKHVAKED